MQLGRKLRGCKDGHIGTRRRETDIQSVDEVEEKKTEYIGVRNHCLIQPCVMPLLLDQLLKRLICFLFN